MLIQLGPEVANADIKFIVSEINQLLSIKSTHIDNALVEGFINNSSHKILAALQKYTAENHFEDKSIFDESMIKRVKDMGEEFLRELEQFSKKIIEPNLFYTIQKKYMPALNDYLLLLKDKKAIEIFPVGFFINDLQAIYVEATDMFFKRLKELSNDKTTKTWLNILTENQILLKNGVNFIHCFGDKAAQAKLEANLDKLLVLLFDPDKPVSNPDIKHIVEELKPLANAKQQAFIEQRSGLSDHSVKLKLGEIKYSLSLYRVVKITKRLHEQLGAFKPSGFFEFSRTKQANACDEIKKTAAKLVVKVENTNAGVGEMIKSAQEEITKIAESSGSNELLRIVSDKKNTFKIY